MKQPLLTAICSTLLLSFGASCIPLRSYSARVADPNEVTVRNEQGRVLLEPGGMDASRVAKQTELPLGLSPVHQQVERRADGAIDFTVRGCPDDTYNNKYRLVAPSGDLQESDLPHSFSGGNLIWNYHASPYSRQHDVGGSLCISSGTLEVKQSQVQWIRKKTYGSPAIGILGLAVGSLFVAGGAVGLERGISEDLRFPTYVGVGALAAGALLLTLGAYQLLRPTTTESIFERSAQPTN